MAVNFPNKKGEPGRVIFRVLHIRVGSAQKDLTTNKEVPFFGARQSDSPTWVRSGDLAFLGEQRNLGTEGILLVIKFSDFLLWRRRLRRPSRHRPAQARTPHECRYRSLIFAKLDGGEYNDSQFAAEGGRRGRQENP